MCVYTCETVYSCLFRNEAGLSRPFADGDRLFPIVFPFSDQRGHDESLYTLLDRRSSRRIDPPRPLLRRSLRLLRSPFRFVSFFGKASNAILGTSIFDAIKIFRRFSAMKIISTSIYLLNFASPFPFLLYPMLCTKILESIRETLRGYHFSKCGTETGTDNYLHGTSIRSGRRREKPKKIPARST